MPKTRLFSVTLKDIEIQTFTVGGHGGGGKDTSNSGVRLIHQPSGARAQCTKHRTNHRNTREAFEKLVKTPEFQKWAKAEAARCLGKPVVESPEEIRSRVDLQFDQDMKEGKVRVEYAEALD